MTRSPSLAQADMTLAVRTLVRSLVLAVLLAVMLGASLFVEASPTPSPLPLARPRPARLDTPYRPSALAPSLGPSATLK